MFYSTGQHQSVLWRSMPVKQGGIIVLAIMLILLAGSSYILVKKFNANAQKTRSDIKTLNALESAKQVLISYAVRFPETDAESGIDEIDGPGYLPCPDVTNDGISGGSCSDSGNTTIGRFPFKTLEVAELRDGNGQRLWYAISEGHRNNPKQIPLNSDTPGQVQVLLNTSATCPSSACTEDVVAVIMAPGEPVAGQGARGSVAESITDYLESENSDLDQVFAQSDGAEFNDRIVFITRNELMAAVEKRVINDVKQALLNYRSTHAALPWLSPYSDPDISTFHGIVDTYAGHVPFHHSDDTPGTTNRNPFQTSVGWIWHTDEGTATGSWSGTVVPDCLRNVDCDCSSADLDCDGVAFPPISAVTAPSIDCVWTNRETADCGDSGWVTTTSVNCNRGCLTSGICERSYYIQYPEYVGTDVNINNPTSATTRSRDVYLSGNLAEQTKAVEIVDTYTGPMPLLCITTGTEVIGNGFINFTSSTTGQMATINIKYDLDIDNNELPSWFVQNDWHEMVYAAYPDSEDYPGTTADQAACTAGVDCPCTQGVDCLKLHWIGASGTEQVSQDIRAMILISGKEIPGQDRSGTATLDDYFDKDSFSSLCQNNGGSSICNYDGNSEFLFGAISSDFNDRIGVLLPN